MGEENKFNNQIVAFIDILGFTEMIKEAQNDDLKAQRIIAKIRSRRSELSI